MGYNQLVDAALTTAAKKNRQEVKNDILTLRTNIYTSKKYSKKFASNIGHINDHYNDLGLNLNDLLAAPEENGNMAALGYLFPYLMKQPTKQKPHEKMALSLLQSNNTLNKHKAIVQQLSARGSKALYIDANGDITGKTDLSRGKSLDFEVTLPVNGKQVKIYISHRYTKEEGGAQDNSLIEIENELSYATKIHSPNTYFIALVDGPYFENRIGNLQLKYSKYNSIKVASSDTIDAAISDIIAAV